MEVIGALEWVFAACRAGGIARHMESVQERQQWKSGREGDLQLVCEILTFLARKLIR